jgi:malonyl-CoA O-methyltransferase
MGHLSGTTSAEVVLDLGCGTGSCRAELRARYPQATYIGLDLAPGMVEYACSRAADDSLWLVGDAESLPLAPDSVDLVFSSLAIQWCQNPELFFAELARVLRPGGRCVFTTLGPDTLRELRQAWAAVDGHQHVNQFQPPGELLAAAARVPGIELTLENERQCMHYQRVAELLAELKTLGAHNMNRGRPAGLASRKALQGMLQAYEAWRLDGLLPASYDVIFGEVTKL